ncbi:hypothetical protein VTN31DRAFT_2760 [Thermomyces dupontii]|uniref:uncharacterized protein n=1 Tax=Talaromyces thermophilus TaxID=28565 RepID=UPI003742078D
MNESNRTPFWNHHSGQGKRSGKKLVILAPAVNYSCRPGFGVTATQSNLYSAELGGVTCPSHSPTCKKSPEPLPLNFSSIPQIHRSLSFPVDADYIRFESDLYKSLVTLFLLTHTLSLFAPSLG